MSTNLSTRNFPKLEVGRVVEDDIQSQKETHTWSSREDDIISDWNHNHKYAHGGFCMTCSASAQTITTSTPALTFNPSRTPSKDNSIVR